MLARTFVMTLVAAIGVTSAAAAQTRSPEHDRLSAMVGQWRTEVETAPAGSRPGTKITGTEECAWFADLHVVCRYQAATETGAYSAIRLVSYVPMLRQYSAYTVDSTGASLLTAGQIDGKTWTFVADSAGAKSRLVLTIAPDGYTGITETSSGRGWVTVSTVKATRVTP
jgi:hypothetical protein